MEEEDYPVGSTAWRDIRELRTINEDLTYALAAHIGDGNIIGMQFLSHFLSLVRDQGDTGACSYVSVIACTEMVYRILGKGVNGLEGRFYFDVQDCFEYTYHNEGRLHELPDLAERRADTMGLGGTAVVQVLFYAHDIGLLTSSSCLDPRERSVAAVLMPHKPHRNSLRWFTAVARGNVIPLLDTYPVIAVMKVYNSFLVCSEVLYRGPIAEDSMYGVGVHTVLLVGKFQLEESNGWKQYVIIQNSHGRGFGFRGFVCVEFDPDLFTHEFWLPFDRQVNLGVEMSEDQLKAVTMK